MEFPYYKENAWQNLLTKSGMLDCQLVETPIDMNYMLGEYID